MARGVFRGILTLPGKIIGRLRTRSDSEHEQAIIRVVIGFLVLGYLFGLPVPKSIPYGGFPVDPRRAILLFVLFSVFVLADILVRPQANPIRRILGTIGDLGATSYIMSISGESGLPLMAVYLWVIMGNGFRYGPRYLYGAIGIGVAGLIFVYSRDSFWGTHPILFWSQMIAITVLPLYMVVLLKKLQKLIEKANEASLEKSRFLANMSHELRTPLNGIIGMTDLLYATGPKPEQRNLLNTIRMSGHTLLDTVRSILDFSKIEAGKLLIEKTGFDFHAFLRETMAILEPLTHQKKLDFAVWVESSVPYDLVGDPNHVRQILVNIVGNAIKFTEEGRVDVRISSLAETETRIRVRIEVKDTGIGIPENGRHRIFESFAQADESVTRRFGGTGLGMTIAKQLVDLMGGTIGFESEVGHGTLFRFEIPFDLREDPDPESFDPSGIKVLVDASGELAERTVFLLRELGVRSIHPSVGREGGDFLRVRKEEAFDTVILECQPISLLLAPPDEARKWYEGPIVRVLIDSQNLGGEVLAQRFSTGFSVVFNAPPDRRSLSNALHLINCSIGDPDAHVLPESAVASGDQKKGRFILVAEDHSVNQQVIKGILEFAGHTVHIVENGEQALDLLDRDFFRFDLMILDMHMPKVGGLDVLKAYRFMERDNPIPAIILTANATLQALAESEEAGAAVYLTKPVDAKRLLSAVDSLPFQILQPPLPGILLKSDIVEDRDGVIDLGMLRHLEELTDKPDFLKDLVERFSVDGHELIREIEEASFPAHFSRFQDAVHSLKGSAAQIGGIRLVQLCMEAEMLKAHSMETGKSLALVERIRDAFLVTSRQLSIHIQGRIPGDKKRRTTQHLPGFNPDQNRVR